MDTIGVLDFGGQYAHLIANRIRRLGAYSEIIDAGADTSRVISFKGLIFSGGPHSVTDTIKPAFNPAILELDIPVLGLCYGHQLLAWTMGGHVSRGDVREYGSATMTIIRDDPIFKGLDRKQKIWMSHGDTVDTLPDGYEILASTPDCAAAAVRNRERSIYGFQFHPEVTDTPGGMQMLENFLNICGCAREWNPDRFLTDIVQKVEEKCKGRKVFLLVSGGVDSLVAFVLLNKALNPERVRGLHIDNGLMRQGESAAIMASLRELGLDNLNVVDASDRFLAALEGITDPELKREVIGEMFIEVQQQALKDLGLDAGEWVVGQGTIYPDTIESAETRYADKIKTHHNRVDSVKKLVEQGLIVEPLANLYKDEVRMLGEKLGIPGPLIARHPFPGPGLAVRTLCSTGRGIRVAPDVQGRIEAIAGPRGYQARILPIRSVGVQGDCRTYAPAALLIGPRDWTVLEELSTGITNAVADINRVVFLLQARSEPRYRLIEAYVTRERLDVLRAVDDCITGLLRRHDQYDQIWQMPVVILPLVNSRREQCIVLRPIMSREAMTARFVALKPQIIDGICSAARQLEGVGDIFLDITHKPPGTIEWE